MKEDVFNIFHKKGLPPIEQLQAMITGPLKKGDFGDIYIEDIVSKSYRLSERIISDLSSGYVSGAGIRVVRENNTGFSYTEDLTKESILKSIGDASRIAGASKGFGVSGSGGKHDLYDIASSVSESPRVKIDLLKRAEKEAFSLSPLVEKVEASLGESKKIILIVNSLGKVAFDIQPMMRFGVSVILKKGLPPRQAMVR